MAATVALVMVGGLGQWMWEAMRGSGSGPAPVSVPAPVPVPVSAPVPPSAPNLPPKPPRVTTGGGNLLAWSEDFSRSDWLKVSATAKPRAAVTWDRRRIGNKIAGSPGGGNHAVVFISAAKPAVAEPYTLSVECKAAEFDWCSIQLFDHVALGMVWFHLAGPGSVGYIWGPADPSITPLGNGWYRCVIVVTSGETTNPWQSWLRPEPADGQTYDYEGDGSRGGYMTRACLRKHLGYSGYTRTTSMPLGPGWARGPAR